LVEEAIHWMQALASTFQWSWQGFTGQQGGVFGW